MNLVLGSTGLLGSAIVRELAKRGEISWAMTRSGLDLRDKAACERCFGRHRGIRVYLCAARVGGIVRNVTEAWEMLVDNVAIQLNVFEAARECVAERILLPGSSCAYPRGLEVMHETDLMAGSPEPTNQPYAIAKHVGIELARLFGNAVVPMLPNLYGPGDNFDLETSHVVAGMMRRMHEAKVRSDSTVTLWGTGKPVREFLFVDDAARVCVDMMESGVTGHHNVTGVSLSVRDLAEMMSDVVGFTGAIEWDTSKPDGFPHKVMAGERRPLSDLRMGLMVTYDWFCQESMRRFDREPRYTWRRTADDVTDVAEPT